MSNEMQQYDIIIRGGTIVDGSGGDPFAGDVAILDGRIAAIGAVAGSAAEEIAAQGLTVTPGFVDPHTHYDGQAIWSERLSPSSSHGVTTVVMGNCGVGFAPCLPENRELLIAAMEGVEDIPGVVMADGLTWEWETFPEFLDALERRRHDIDFAVFLPHSAVRVHAMGQRGANREPATPDDVTRMVELTREGMEAGAIGFATSRINTHRRIDGENLPSYQAAEQEMHPIATEVARHGGLFQLVPELSEARDEGEARLAFDFLRRLSGETGAQVTFTFAPMPDLIGTVADLVRQANSKDGVRLRPQMFPRPIGMILGLEISANPFLYCPSYMALSELPLAKRVDELRKPEVRQRILGEEPGEAVLPLMKMARRFEKMFRLGTQPDYEPDPETSIAAEAARRGITPEEVAYDALLEDGGQTKLWIALSGLRNGVLDDLRDLLVAPDFVIGLGDGGAHYGLICDASYPTFMLTHWVRDRERGRLPLPAVIRALSSTPAEMLGLADRGTLKVGLKADINVIDFDGLRLLAPDVKTDLPAGGRRLDQGASGYRYTIASGKIVRRNDTPTDELPGRLIRHRSDGAMTRGQQPADAVETI